MADQTPTIPNEWVRLAYEAHDAVWTEQCPQTQGEAVVTHKDAWRAGLAAVVPHAEARAAERIAAAIEAHAESIGWYEGGGAWSDSIEIAREAGAAEPHQPDTPEAGHA